MKWSAEPVLLVPLGVVTVTSTVPAAWAGAVAVIQPSLFEGWSTVVEDARALGKTMALSDISVHREQGPPHSAYFDPHAPEELAALMRQWWTDAPPGPDPRREEEARHDNEEAVLAMGTRFLCITEDALEANLIGVRRDRP